MSGPTGFSAHAGEQGLGEDTSKTPRIGVVVPAYKSERTLPRCLAALTQSGFSPDQILVVDDGSPDRGAEIASAMGIRTIRLQENGGPAVARNAGARASDAQILFFVDADVVLHPGARDRIERFFRENPDHVAVFGAYDAQPPEGGVVSRFRNLLHRYVHVSNAGEASTFWTGCGAVRKEAFEAAGGFDPAPEWVMIEDVVLGVAMRENGGRIWIDPELQCAHLKAWTLSSMCRTDLFHRAMPWTRLLATSSGRKSAEALNVSYAGRVSGLAVAASCAALALAIAGPLAGLSPLVGLGLLAASIAVLAGANSGFLAMMLRERGPGEALTAVPLLWLHYLCALLGFAAVKLLER